MAFQTPILVRTVRYQLIVMIVSRTSVGFCGSSRCYESQGSEALSIDC